MAVWKTATAGFNYHVEVEKSFYSLPFRYIKYKVDIRLTARVVEIFYNGQRICSHPRYYVESGHTKQIRHICQPTTILIWNGTAAIPKLGSVKSDPNGSSRRAF
jgi:hypothetical protein